MALSMQWQKSRRSEANGACIEVRLFEGVVQVRDSKDPEGPRLSYSTEQWTLFVENIRRFEADA